MTFDASLQTTMSQPGAFGLLLDALPTDPLELAAAVGEVYVHYRRTDVDVPPAHHGDVHLRSVAAKLALDQARHPMPLTSPRPTATRVQGCCRDFALLLTSTLRRRGVPARLVVGFASYLTPGWHHDHVITEAVIGGAPVLLDPEVPSLNPIRTGFQTAARAWLSYRRGALDSSTFGVHPTMPMLAGENAIAINVMYQLAHRYGDELLLWHTWGVLPSYVGSLSDETASLVDDLSAELLAADEDPSLETSLEQRYRRDARLHPPDEVLRLSPFGGPSIRERWRP